MRGFFMRELRRTASGISQVFQLHPQLAFAWSVAQVFETLHSPERRVSLKIEHYTEVRSQAIHAVEHDCDPANDYIIDP